MAQSIVLEGVCFSDKKSEYCADDRRTDVAVNEGGGLLVCRARIRFQHRLRRRATRGMVGLAGLAGRTRECQHPTRDCHPAYPVIVIRVFISRADRQR